MLYVLKAQVLRQVGAGRQTTPAGLERALAGLPAGLRLVEQARTSATHTIQVAGQGAGEATIPHRGTYGTNATCEEKFFT